MIKIDQNFFYPDITIHTPIKSPSRVYSKYIVFRNIYILCVPMALRKDLYPILIFYFEEEDKGFPKRFSDLILDAWFG